MLVLSRFDFDYALVLDLLSVLFCCVYDLHVSSRRKYNSNKYVFIQTRLEESTAVAYVHTYYIIAKIKDNSKRLSAI